jgi:hypothetical protein
MQWRPVANQPNVPERINKPALPMDTPGSFVVPYFIDAAIGAGLHRTFNECIRIIAKYFYPGKECSFSNVEHNMAPTMGCQKIYTSANKVLTELSIPEKYSNGVLSNIDLKKIYNISVTRKAKPPAMNSLLLLNLIGVMNLSVKRNVTRAPMPPAIIPVIIPK